ncbi:hypothetical protein [Sphingomonas sp. Leaf38]|uniref:hypothetical protein n=1 Tax=Sphingomonas sp. Leaf38 TaxID=1736217 RepID=UPI0006FAE442|nr:hypothetical protein [Sphingomonas sp. Leaf38]KQN36749.1 hypothetical protein ASE88_00040 [Sphingomonas sp. Leaf38]
MSDAAPTRMTLKDPVTLGASLVGAAFAIGGALRADGSRNKQVEDNTRRIVILGKVNQAKNDLLTKFDGRTIRIETNLGMMSPARKVASGMSRTIGLSVAFTHL